MLVCVVAAVTLVWRRLKAACLFVLLLGGVLLYVKRFSRFGIEGGRLRRQDVFFRSTLSQSILGQLLRGLMPTAR